MRRTRPLDKVGDCVIVTLMWSMWQWDTIPPVDVDADIDTLIGGGQANAGTVITSEGSFQVKVCCEETEDPERGTVCRARCTLLNQTP